MATFKFLNLGQRVRVFVNNVLAQINTSYNDSDAVKIEKQDNNHYGEPFDEIQYQAFDTVSGNELKSNIAKIIVDFPPNKSISPSSTNNEILIENNQEISIINSIAYNAAVDRIKILSFSNIGNFRYNLNSIYPGQQVMNYDFELLKYKSLSSGFGNPYQEIKYQVGNINGYNPTIFSLKINIDGLASLIEVEPADIEENEQSKSIIYNTRISNGFINKTAKVKIETSLPEEVFTSDSEITVIYRNNSIDITQNGEIEIETTLDQIGEDNILLNMTLMLENNNINGFIKFTLLEVNNNNDLVSTQNEQILTLTA